MRINKRPEEPDSFQAGRYRPSHTNTPHIAEGDGDDDNDCDGLSWVEGYANERTE
jgi:hypothetical protein